MKAKQKQSAIFSTGILFLFFLLAFPLLFTGCSKAKDAPVISVRLQWNERAPGNNSATFSFEVTNESDQIISFDADRFACVKHEFHKVVVPTDPIKLAPQEAHSVTFTLSPFDTSSPTSIRVTTYTNEGTTATISHQFP